GAWASHRYGRCAACDDSAPTAFPRPRAPVADRLRVSAESFAAIAALVPFRARAACAWGGGARADGGELVADGADPTAGGCDRASRLAGRRGQHRCAGPALAAVAGMAAGRFPAECRSGGRWSRWSEPGRRGCGQRSYGRCAAHGTELEKADGGWAEQADRVVHLSRRARPLGAIRPPEAGNAAGEPEAGRGSQLA